MFVRSASTHNWEAQFNALSQPFGGVKCWAKLLCTAHSKVAKWVQQIWSLWHATNAVGSDILGVPSSTTTPSTINLSAQPHHSILILRGLAGNDLFQQTWKVIHCTRTCDLASAFCQCCQTTNFTKFKTNLRNLGSTFLHKYGLVVLHQHVINFHFVKTSALILVQWEHLAGPSWKYEGPYS